VRELVNAGDIQRSQAQDWVDNLVERSHKSSEQILELVRHEVATQLEKIDPRSLESLANQVAEVLRKSAKAGRNATKDVTTRAGKTAKDVTAQAGKTAKDVTSKAGKTAKDATNKAGQTAKGVTAQAGKAAKDVTAQAGKTASRARDAATSVAPSRLPGIKTPARSTKTKSDTKKSQGKKVSEADNSATKKAAS
jgi:hypothetical protein